MSQVLPAIDTASALETLLKTNKVHNNLRSGPLVEHAVRRGEGHLADNGAFAAYTGKFTGRTPKDRFTVKDSITSELVNWGDVNQPFSPEKFDALFERVLAYLRGKELFVQDLYAGADPKYRLPVRVINELAWQDLFVRALFVRPSDEELKSHRAEFTVIGVPGFLTEPQRDGTRSEAFIAVNFTRKLVLVCGSGYAGEMKKSIFSVMNFLLPQRNVFPMHCSANVGNDGVTALYFGLSGTGKTTLSADPERRLIGDDEHGWSPTGIFNFEGGCYAKTIKLSKENEPQIWNAIRFGSVLENVVLDLETRVPDYNDVSLTENTRCAYPIEYIDNAVIPGVGGHPKNVMFLTALACCLRFRG
jgi:phosphoenolpyruvate carboxykinase (ATP)